MSVAIRVAGLGKRYRIGALRKRRHDTLRDAIMSRLRFRPGGMDWSGDGVGASFFWAVKDVSFQVQEGEILGIIGRNGAGKSTLLKILSRITRPTEGYAELRGRVGSLLEVGTGFHPELTGRENIFLNGAILGMHRAEIKSKFDEIVAFSEVEKFIDTPVKHYSSGMYVRLAFSVAAHLETEILLVDEVLAVGDAAFQQKCLGRMDQVSHQGRTVFFVSHNLSVIRKTCPRVCWMDGGTLRMDGTAEKVTAAYLESTNARPSGDIRLRRVERSSDQVRSLLLTRVVVNEGGPTCHGESLSIRLEYENVRPQRDVAVGVGICSLEGVRIMTFDSDLEEESRDLPAGPGAVALHLDRLPLQPGRYSVDVGARTSAGTTLDYLEGCFELEVRPGSRTPTQITRGQGGVRLPASWQWTTVR
jgi:lipopolysaccharide transport system ATP-binding protein